MIEKTPPKASYPFELKDTRGKNYFNFDELKEDQINHALKSKTRKGNLIRVVAGTPGAPDYIYLKNCSYAFVVIKYPTLTVMIDIDDFLNEKKRSERKSLTLERALEISTNGYSLE